MTAANYDIGAVRLARWLKIFSQWDGWFLVFGGGTVLLGWILGNESLKRVFPRFVAMNPLTAIGFIIAGVALLLFWQSKKGSSLVRIGSRILAGILILFGALKLSEYCFGWHSFFDQIFFRNKTNHGTVLANQMAPSTAFNFLISGGALWLLNSSQRRFPRLIQNLCLLLLFISLIPLVGYIYQASYFYSIGSFPMALNTAILFCLLALGILLAQTDCGVVAVFTSKTPGGTIARRLLPFAFGVPFVLGILGILSEKKNLYPAGLGICIMVVGSIAVFSALIWWNAISLNRTDKKRREMELDLQKSYDELELRVTERTANLRQTNEALQAQIALQQKSRETISEQTKLLDEARDAILVLDLDHCITFWNKGAERMYGLTVEEAVGKNADDLLFASGRADGFSKIFSAGSWTGELQQMTKTSEPMIVESSWSLVKDDAGKPKGILIINTDITEKKSYAAQLLRAQRMESLGALAGGIAHDLNNALAPVIMGAELLKKSQTEAKSRLMLETILASAYRGSQMVRQILSFARGSQGRTGQVLTAELMTEMEKILNDTFPKFISIQSITGRELWGIRGDVTELHQVLLNLCVNARDAMPVGGQLTLAAENVTVKKENIPPNFDATPGPYVMLSVTDTGTGIPPEVLPRIFEPFFTTKSPEKGTGLGLSTVSNIVRNHNGFMEIKSESGKGTCFKVFLPACEKNEAAKNTVDETVLPDGHGELILVVDDEQAVRELTKTTLENYGYRVVTASNGLLGVTCFDQYKEEICVVVSDTDMPFSNGLEAIRTIQQLKPDIRIIIASGGSRDTAFFRKLDKTHISELPKPYTVEQLLNAVADAIKTMEHATETNGVPQPAFNGIF